MKLKKILSLLMVATLLVGFTSCSGDDDNTVVGSWQYSSIAPVVETSIPEVAPIITAFIQQQLSPIASGIDFTLTLKDDNTCVLTAEGEPLEGTYTYSNDKLTITGAPMQLFAPLTGGLNSATFGVSFSGSSLVLELDAVELFGDLGSIGSLNGIEGLEDIITKLAIAVTLNRI